jgi:hypothetical protein
MFPKVDRGAGAEVWNRQRVNWSIREGSYQSAG